MQRVLLGHAGRIYSLEFSADGLWLASCDQFAGPAGSTVRVWEVATGRQVALLPVQGWSWGAILSPDGRRLAAISNGNLMVWNRAANTWATDGRVQSLTAVAWTTDSQQIIGSHEYNQLWVYDAATLDVVREASCSLTYALRLSPDGKWLAVRTRDAEVEVWDVQTLAPLRTFAADVPLWASLLTWYPDSRRLGVPQEGKPFVIFDATNGKQVATFPFPGPAAAIRDAGREIVLDHGARLQFCNSETGEFRHTENFSQGNLVDKLSPSPGGRRLLVHETYDFTWLCIGPTGHVRGGPIPADGQPSAEFPATGDTPESLAAIEDLIVYVAQLEDGSQVTLTPREFSEKSHWQNYPAQATLMKLEE